jgi:hypothetical protein
MGTVKANRIAISKYLPGGIEEGNEECQLR